MADEIDDAALDAGRKANIETRDSEVEHALAMSDFAGAIHKSLENPPLGTKDPEIKVWLAACPSHVDSIPFSPRLELVVSIVEVVYPGGYNEFIV